MVSKDLTKGKRQYLWDFTSSILVEKKIPCPGWPSPSQRTERKRNNSDIAIAVLGPGGNQGNDPYGTPVLLDPPSLDLTQSSDINFTVDRPVPTSFFPVRSLLVSVSLVYVRDTGHPSDLLKHCPVNSTHQLSSDYRSEDRPDPQKCSSSHPSFFVPKPDVQDLRSPSQDLDLNSLLCPWGDLLLQGLR